MKTEIKKDEISGHFCIDIFNSDYPDLRLNSTYMFEYDFQAHHICLMLDHAFNLGKIEGMRKGLEIKL